MKREQNPLPGILHDSDAQNKNKHRKMLKRLQFGHVPKQCKWYRNYVKRNGR